jgi:CheY-like chemotaxis protein
MKKVLFLDDSKERQTQFANVFKVPDTSVDYVDTADEAMRALKDKVYDVTFLDHDLGGKIFVKEVEGTGYQVALFIKKLPPERRPYQVIIHTHNPDGARRMYESLKGSVKVLQVLPFIQLISALTQKP